MKKTVWYPWTICVASYVVGVYLAQSGGLLPILGAGVIFSVSLLWYGYSNWLLGRDLERSNMLKLLLCYKNFVAAVKECLKPGATMEPQLEKLVTDLTRLEKMYQPEGAESGRKEQS